MSNLPELSTPKTPALNELLLRVFFIGLLGPLCVLLAAYLMKYAQDRQSNRLWASYSVVGTFAGLVIMSQAAQLAQYLDGVFLCLGLLLVRQDVALASLQLTTSLFPFWVAMLPLAPAGAVGMKLWKTFEKLIGTKTVQEMLDAERAAQLKAERKESQKVAQKVTGRIGQHPGAIELGAYFSGKTDQFPKDLGVLKQHSLLYLLEDIFFHHMFIHGAPGAGKTVTILRLVAELLTNTECDVYLVDGKAMDVRPPTLIEMVRALVHHSKGWDTKVFRLGQEESGAKYNGFYGQAGTIYNRLLGMAGVQNAKDNAEFYADANRVFLYLVCHVDDGPPRDFDMLMRRLNLDWLRAQWQHKWSVN